MTQSAITHPLPFYLEEAAIRKFRDTLSSPDQLALDELLEAFAADRQAAAPTAAALPLELLLIALLLEQHKTLQFLVSRLNYYDHKLFLRRVKNIPSDGEVPRT